MIVICVRGTANTGKTSAVRAFLKSCGVYLPDKPRDVRIVVPLLFEGQLLRVGVVSGGDSGEVVAKGLEFLGQHNCQVVVCAARSYGDTHTEVDRFVRQHNAQLEPVPTRWMTATEREAETARIVKEIRRLIVKRAT